MKRGLYIMPTAEIEDRLQWERQQAERRAADRKAAMDDRVRAAIQDYANAHKTKLPRG